MITPDLLEWIRSCLKSGHAPAALADSMIKSGWERSMAQQALARVLAERGAPNAAAVLGNSEPAESIKTVPVPEPSLDGDPTHVIIDGHRIEVIAAMKHPRLVVFGNVLTHAECDALMEEARPQLERSTGVTVDGGSEITPIRTSDGMFFQRGASELIRRIEERFSKLLNWPVENGEGLQVLRYRLGNEYKPHNDYFYTHQPGAPKLLARGGNRVGTLIVYLQSPDSGGATAFTDIDFTVAPVKGNAVFFSYNRAHADTKTMHAGVPVQTGEKWICTKWMREREFV